MALGRKDEVLGKALTTDPEGVVRYDLIKPDGTKLAENVQLELKNPVQVAGMPQNKKAWDECLAASGLTAGGASALTLVQPDFTLFDGACVRFRLHTMPTPSPNVTLNVNGTGARRVVNGKGKPLKGLAAGNWVTVVYSSTLAVFVLQGDAGGTLRFGNDPGQISAYQFILDAWRPDGTGN